MNQEQEKFQKSLRELLASAKEHGQQITAEQAERFAQEQDLTEEQRAMVFDYLALEQVEVTGAEKKQRKTERVETPLSAEEEQFLKRYLEELPVPGELGEAEKTELFRQAAKGDTLSKSRLVEYYMPRLSEIARSVFDGSVFFGDLVQEGNVCLLLALEHIDPEAGERGLLGEIREGMEEILEEQRVQKHRDETMVNKVNRLKDAIEDLSDGEKMDFSVAELSAYLDMSVEEIEDILRLTGDDK